MATGTSDNVENHTKDTFIPRFDNTTAGYKEWRKRIQLYARRMAIQKRESEIGISVLSTLTGASWRQCEDLEVRDLEAADGLGRILDRLDAQWQYDGKIEMPEAFERYFYKTYRTMNQTMLDYCTQSGQALRELSKYKVTLPDEVAGWLLMRRAGLTKEQTQLIQTTIGTETTVEKVEKALYLTLGQNHKVPSPAKFQNMRGRWKSDRAHFAEDEVYYEDDGEYYEDESHAFDDDGNPAEYDGEESYWQEEEWDTQSTYYGSAVEDMPASDVVFDTEEFDRVYAAYADSKRQLNQLRVSRGFFPVVAVAGGQQLPLGASASASGSHSPSRSGSSKGKSKGKGKSKKGSKGSKGLSSPN